MPYLQKYVKIFDKQRRKITVCQGYYVLKLLTKRRLFCKSAKQNDYNMSEAHKENVFRVRIESVIFDISLCHLQICPNRKC